MSTQRREHIPANLPIVKQTLDITCGAACFASMYELFFGECPGELFFAEKLRTIELGMTPPENIVQLAKIYGLQVNLRRCCKEEDLRFALKQEKIIFVSWWFEDAGHYSLVRHIHDDVIVLMDPWRAREGKDTIMARSEFITLWNCRGSLMIEVSTACFIKTCQPCNIQLQL